MAGIIGGPLSGLILENFHEVWGFRNWQWLLFLEGLPAVVAGIVAWFYLTDKPQDAKWLTNQEKLIVLNALEEENRQKPENAPSSLMAALRDPRVYVIAAGWATVPICGTILNYWTPTIIKQTGVSNMLHIGFLSALPYLVGAVAMLFIARRLRPAIGAPLAFRPVDHRWCHWRVDADVVYRKPGGCDCMPEPGFGELFRCGGYCLDHSAELSHG